MNVIEWDWLDNKVPVLNATAIIRDMLLYYICYYISDNLSPAATCSGYLFSLWNKNENKMCFESLFHPQQTTYRCTLQNIVRKILN